MLRPCRSRGMEFQCARGPSPHHCTPCNSEWKINYTFSFSLLPFLSFSLCTSDFQIKIKLISETNENEKSETEIRACTSLAIIARGKKYHSNAVRRLKARKVILNFLFKKTSANSGLFSLDTQHNVRKGCQLQQGPSC